jgi:hypothetical protein
MPNREDGLHPAVTVPTSASPSTTSVDGLLALAVERGVPVETLERLLAMRTQLKAEAAREAFLAALSAFQADCPVIHKGRTAGGGSYTYRYAPLEDIVRAITPLLHRHGLSYRFDTAFEATERGQAQVVTCIVHHRDGHSERSEFRTPIDSNGRMNVMQQAASAQTYGKRYALLAALGIVVGGEDDDGHGVGDSRTPTVRPVGQGRPREAAAPALLGRNLVRIPSRAPRDSDGEVDGESVEPSSAAATSARSETDDSERAELRKRLIEGMMWLLRTRTQYASWPASELWDKAAATLEPWCQMNFGSGLVDLDRAGLARAVDKMDRTVKEREAAGV